MALSDDRLAELLDLLCSVPDAPADLVRDLRLFQRIRSMDEEHMVLPIDSLFELDTVPYARSTRSTCTRANCLPSGRWTGWPADWHDGADTPAGSLYGAWNTTNPNAYGPAPDPNDSLLLLKLTDPDWACGFSMPIEGIVTSRFGWRDGRNHNGWTSTWRSGTRCVRCSPAWCVSPATTGASAGWWWYATTTGWRASMPTCTVSR